MHLTRDQARALFVTANLNYSILTKERVQRLRTLVNAKMKESGLIKGAYRCHQRPIIRPGHAEIRCKASYFENREAITFNTDGFIGFAGWADDRNIQPVLAGFAAWVSEVTP